MLTYPAIDPIIVSLGPLAVRWYGVTYVIAFGVAWWLARRRAGVPGSTWTPQQVDDLIFCCAIGVILGGRLGWVLFYGLETVAHDPMRLIRIWEGGMSFHGGFIGVLIAAAWFTRTRKKHIADVCDFLVPLPGIGIFAVRVANFINGELWGKPTTVPWGFKLSPEGLYPQQSLELLSLCRRFQVDPCQLTLHGSQLYEALSEGLLLFIIVWWFTSKPRLRVAASGLFLICYGIARFTVEFVRVPDENRGYFLGDWLTMGQLLSAPMIIVGIVLMFVAYRRRIPTGNRDALQAEAA
ncbi:MAG TPA: prolipoprotein diacylglyceryl transferase [Steroidobacteraceae bacterium]|nr:prolipoprotein diacylglyceryl transferase [Steroidobacteraceae bacterium]